MRTMKQNLLFWFLSFLICASLSSCSFPFTNDEPLPPVEVLPPAQAQPPADQPPAQAQPPADQSSGDQPAALQQSVDQPPAGSTSSLQIESVTVDSTTAGSGTISATVSYSLQEGSDGINCYVTGSSGSVLVFTQPSQAVVGIKSKAFTFPLTETGSHTLTCSNLSKSSLQSDSFTVDTAQQSPDHFFPTIMNPGFEDGFNGWTELPAALTYGGQSVDEDVVSRTGSHSRKLFLRYGGSYIFQRIPLDTSLPPNSQITLAAWVKMPYAGTKANKCFTLELVIGNDNNQQKSAFRDQFDVLPNWTEITVTIANFDFPATWIEIRAMTNKGDGIYHNSDQPVYVDDFGLLVYPAQP
jgi:hypothetical protein